MQRLARFCVRRRRAVLGVWALLLVGLLTLANVAGGVFQVDFALPGSETQKALDLLETHGFEERSGEQGQIVVETDSGVVDPAVRAALEGLFARITDEIDGVQVVGPYSDDTARQIAPGGDIAYAEMNFTDRKSAEYADDADRIRELRDEVSVPGLRIELGGDIFAEEAGSPSEAIGVLLAIVILLVAFGSLLAMGLPIATALVGIGCGAAIVMLLANFLDMPDFTVQAVLMISIGVGIDYALFIVTRYRESLSRGSDPEDAVVTSLDTAGRAVLFAGTTVVIALMGLLILNNDTFRGVAVGTTIGVLVTMLASLTAGVVSSSGGRGPRSSSRW
jgi:RND superfamily putative drug exporter